MDKAYHHGDLKRALIETGIELISREGEESLSLRKVAARCGVSNAAPYAHFQSKDDMLSAMKEYVTQEFCRVLDEVIADCPGDDGILARMGIAYVAFFIENPNYFSFLFTHSNITVDLGADADPELNYRPYELLRQTALRVLGQKGIPAAQIHDKVIAMWALVHGLSSIAIMKNVQPGRQWTDIAKAVMGFSLLY